MRILFVGESWLGSCARSLREALARLPGVAVDEVNEEASVPRHRARWLRAINRLLGPAHRQELHHQILYRVGLFKPDIVMTYKGAPLRAEFLRELQRLGCRLVNVYPDFSPHVHGLPHKLAMGVYDLVISTKYFHPGLWKSLYGYDNPCLFVPQGYDSALHLVDRPDEQPEFDVTLVANWRREYGDLMKAVARGLDGHRVSVGIGGIGWLPHKHQYPEDWVFAGALEGRSYVNWLRRGRICLAFVNPEIVVNGVVQPGDKDTTRTYELAAAYCFFIHRRNDYVQALYSEATEVPMFDTPGELVDKILRYLPQAEARKRMAAAAHRRAVPAYSMDQRASEVVDLLKRQFGL
jgi:hypothetical protein